jgi:hypothetical protein
MVLNAVDNFSAYVRTTLCTNEQIRTSLSLGPANMPVDKQRMAAEMLDMWIAKPLPEAETNMMINRKRGRDNENDGGIGYPERNARSRYCYSKIVPAGPTTNELFTTYWWAPNGQALSLERVRNLRNFFVVPFVEVEDVFASKAVKSLRMKLRECIVFLPAERPTHRFSVAFEDKVCGTTAVVEPEEDEDVDNAPPIEVAAPVPPQITVTVETTVPVAVMEESIPNSQSTAADDDAEQADDEGITAL